MRMMGIGDAIRLHHGGFDATGLAEILKVETGAEARALAQNAVDANAAAQKAALAGNVADASRYSRISDDRGGMPRENRPAGSGPPAVPASPRAASPTTPGTAGSVCDLVFPSGFRSRQADRAPAEVLTAVEAGDRVWSRLDSVPAVPC